MTRAAAVNVSIVPPWRGRGSGALAFSAGVLTLAQSSECPPVLQLQEGQLLVRHFQFLRWSPYRDVPDSRKAFLSLLAQVHSWQRECGEGRTVVHCL